MYKYVRFRFDLFLFFSPITDYHSSSNRRVRYSPVHIFQSTQEPPPIASPTGTVAMPSASILVLHLLPLSTMIAVGVSDV
mmetsp:Transcript_16392/g.35670  ORF Transcript_16392/g.35670 Transcript_16392/m.35670 type:complete len:80 (-) Transcript_16392:1448-1687(-)